MVIRLVSYLVLTLLFTIVLGGTQEAMGFLVGQIILPQLAPGLAALVVVLLFRKDGIKPTLSLTSVASVSSLYAILVPAGAAFILYMIATQITRILPIGDISLAQSPVSLTGMVIGAIGEELGWRGYLHKMLDRRLSGWVSSLVVGVPWALWHVGYYQNGPLFMLVLVILITSYSFVLYALVHKTGFNVWIASLFHLMINVANVPFLPVLSRLDFMVVNALVWATIAGVVVMRNRPLFFTPRTIFTDPSDNAPLVKNSSVVLDVKGT